jgi:hypothetical protein
MPSEKNLQLATTLFDFYTHTHSEGYCRDRNRRRTTRRGQKVMGEEPAARHSQYLKRRRANFSLSMRTAAVKIVGTLPSVY